MMKCVHTSEDNETSCPVRSVDSIVIPSRHEAVIKSKVIPSTNMKEAILVPLMKFVNTHGLVVGQVLVNTENSEIYVRVFNPGDKKVFVKENTEIALVTCVDFFSDELPNSMMCNVETGNKSKDIPEFLREMYTEGCNNLTPEQAEKFKQFLFSRKAAFADPEMPLQRSNVGEHRINLNEEKPFKEPVRRVPIFKRDILDAEINKLKTEGLIEESVSPWSSPLVLVQKKDKTWRLCVDYRRLNAQTIKDAYPIPRIAEDLDALSGSSWFTSLDLNMAYHQIPMRDSDKEKTAFGTPRGGLYQYTVMPF